MRELKVKITDCSCDDLFKVAKKCGFADGTGKKHYKIETIDGKFIATIPRHFHLSKETVKGILKRFILFGANIKIS